jgi:hypothetical protein
MAIPIRIKELTIVPARDLVPHPKNWRVYPPSQRSALKSPLGELGYCDALVARQLSDVRFQILDRHLRGDLTPDMDLPVLLLDLSDMEAEKLVVTRDPLACLAEANRDASMPLLVSVESEGEPLQALFNDLAAGQLTPIVDSEAKPGFGPTNSIDVWSVTKIDPHCHLTEKPVEGRSGQYIIRHGR